MASTVAEFNERELAQNMTMIIAIKRSWRVRLGLLFVRFGLRLAGFGMKVVEE